MCSCLTKVRGHQVDETFRCFLSMNVQGGLMSLEDPDVDKHADVFAFFFALCVMLAIRLPFVVNFSLTCNKSFGHQTTRVDFYGYPVIQWFRKNMNLL